jgi:hypothetical protein
MRQRRVGGGRAPADDRADRDGDREIECAELGNRAPFAQAQAYDGYREEQDGLDRHPSQTARATDQLRHLRHPPALVTPSMPPPVHAVIRRSLPRNVTVWEGQPRARRTPIMSAWMGLAFQPVQYCPAQRCRPAGGSSVSRRLHNLGQDPRKA